MNRIAKLIGGAAFLGFVAAGCGNPDPIGLGVTPPSFTVEGLSDGSKVQSDSLKGKVVIVDFWATWCGPCNEELPQVEKIWQRYKGQGVEMLAISTEAKDTLANFQKVTKTGVPIYMDSDNRVNDVLHITGYPTTFILGKDGRVVYSSVGYGEGVDREIDDAIKKALG